MPSTDDRVVAMQFDNKVFEQKVAETIKSIDALKTSLDFKNASKGFDDINSHAKAVNLEGIASAIEGIGSKFSAMGAIAFTILQNVTTMAIDAGVKIAKSLSLDQVIAGFQEYETNMNAIQTVMANTKADGTTLDDVNGALDELNTYSDKTIYNFGEMARNIGTFTAAGVNLDTSVSAIKGIANLAAISGSNSQQASTAMYQLSQALASGSVKLMDWNSIVNAGMGGEVFQKSLFETGKALGTIKDVPLAMTFDEWKDAGNTFRGSLEEGWLTADVLTNTLQGFTGDLTDAQLLSLGYTKDQVAEIQEMGKTAQEAATKVKTVTQLVGTIKESIGSGWSATFRILIGDFEEARDLFTGINNVIGAMVGRAADARNKLLQGWKDMGGRDTLIAALISGIMSLRDIIIRVKRAFADVFPPMTAHQLVTMTNNFKAFMDALAPSPITLNKIRRIFTGIFSAFSIGIDIVKGIAGVFKELFDHFKGAETSSSGILGFFANIADKITNLRETLTSNEIAKFFADLPETVQAGLYKAKVAIHDFITNFSFDKLIELLGTVKDKLLGLFDKSGIEAPAALTGAIGVLKERFESIKGVIDKVMGVWDSFKEKLGGVRDFINGIGGWLKEQFANIPQAIANVFANTDYSTGLDAVNTGLFAGLVLLIKKFLDNGLDFGGGIISSIKESLDGLTGTLEAMQTKLKAEALLNIAKALGLLVVSVVILSMIDSGALTKSMTAMAVGFGQLVGAMAALDKVTTAKSAGKLSLVSTAILILAGALVVMSIAVKILSTMNIEEMAQGLVGIAVMLGLIMIAVKPLSDNSDGMIKAGLGIIAIAIALNILALAVKSFAEMSWEEMAQGLIGVSVGLVAITLAMDKLPGKDAIGKGIGMIAIGVALNLIAMAVKSFSDMDIVSMAKGLIGVGVAMVIVAKAMKLMPKNMLAQGVAMAAIGIGLVLIAQAVETMGGLSWSEMAKGLVGLAGALTVLAIAAYAMEGSILGAVAIGIMALSLGKLAEGLMKFSTISWGDLLHGLGALGATLAVLALAGLAMEPVVVVLLGLGAALLLVGLAFALFGVGANLVATAFSIIATAGTQGVATVMEALDGLIARLPDIISGLADGFILLGTKILEAAPEMITKLGVVIALLLQLVIDNIPKMAEVFVKFVQAILDTIVKLTPDIIAAGLSMLISLLKGIEDNIEEITTTVIGIITKFLDTLADHAEEIVTAGLTLLTKLLNGISDNIDDVTAAAAGVITSFITAIETAWLDIISAGVHMIVKLIEGIGNAAILITTAAVTTFITFLTALQTNILLLVDAGFDFIIAVLDGIADSIDKHSEDFRNAGLHIAGSIINGMTFGLAGKVAGVFSGAEHVATGIVDAMKKPLKVESPSKVMIGIGEDILAGLVIGMSRTKGVEDATDTVSTNVISNLKDTLSQIPTAVESMDEFNPTITPVLDLSNVQSKANALNSMLNSGTMTADVSYSQAASIAEANRNANAVQEAERLGVPASQISFTQINQSPEALSTADIYRQTHNQIALAKEELAVL